MDNDVKSNSVVDSALNNEETEIDLIDLFFFLRTKILYVFIALVIGVLGAGGYSYLRIEPTYRATSYIYMVSASTDSMINLSDLNIGTSIAEDYQQLLLRRPIVENVVDQVKGLSVEGHDKESDKLVLVDETDLTRYVTLSIVGQSRVLKIEVLTTDPTLSRDIANAFADQAVEYIPEITQSSAPTVAEYAVKPTHKAGPSNTKNAMIGGLALMVLVLGYYTMIYLLDDSIKSEDDLEKYFGIIAISSIPEGEIHFGDDEIDEKERKKAKKSIFRIRGRR